MPDHKLFKVNQNAILQTAEGLVLILKKDDKWMLPGGRLEEDETWLEGLHREVREETGIQEFSIEKILDVDTSDSQETYIITFLCKIKENPKVTLSDEHQDYAWLNIVNITKYEFWHKNIAKRLTMLLGATAS
jgi:8-oxo-dGTP pyrophosphatase MutT (NUDIX family)